MSKKEMSYEEFKEKYIKGAVNVIDDSGLGEDIKEIMDNKDGFDVLFICKKCGCRKTQFIGDNGIDYGGMTGYSPGSNVIKCTQCGNAVTIWK